MDTKSKNSRKFGILILILLFLAASSAVMMLQYGTIRRQIESVQEEGSRSGNGGGMANTLAEGNYLLYNRYVRDTDPAEAFLYGQQRFDLAEKIFRL